MGGKPVPLYSNFTTTENLASLSVSNHEPGRQRTQQRQNRTGHHYYAKAPDERRADCLLDCGPRFFIYLNWYSRRGQLAPFCVQRPSHLRGTREMVEVSIETPIERLHHDQPQHGDSEQARGS